MATLTERLNFLITGDADDAVRAFRSTSTAASTELGKAEQSTSKWKTATSGAFNFVKANAVSFATAAAGAIAAFAVKAVGQFQELALPAGQFADATGIAVEDASRWIEVAGDVGVGADAIQTAIQRMNANIASGKLDEFSDAVVRAKDGTVDASATFQTLVTRIGAIPDPTKRAQAAQDAFGRSYGQIAELMEMDAEQLAEALASVSDEKIIDEGELGNAREFRAAMDKLTDAAEDLTLKIGSGLVPVLTDAADALGSVSDMADVGWLGTLADQVVTTDNLFEGLSEALDGNRTGWQRLGGAVSLVTGAFPVLGEQTQKLGGETLSLEDAAKRAVEALGLQKGGTDTSAEAAEAAAEAQQAEADAIQAATDKMLAQATALEEQADAQRAAADSTFAVRDAEDDFVESLTTANDKIAEADGDLRKIRAVYDSVAQGAGKLADATVRQATEQAKANGTTLTAKQQQDAWNQSMLTSAASASGPLRASILAYVGQVNGIPEAKATEIQAAVDQGDLNRANWLLADASKTRDARVEAEAITAAAENQMAYLARTRTARINPELTPIRGAYASGGGASGRVLVGEEGPEVVDLPPGSFVHPANSQPTRQAVGGQVTYYAPTVNQYFPAGVSERAVADAQLRWTRRNGPT